MSRSRSLLRVLGLLALTSCIDRSSSSLFVYIDEGSAVATFRSGSDGPIVAISLDVYAENEGLTYLDSALVVVNTDGQSTTFNDPTIDAPGFPAEYDGGVVELEVPSPIVDIDTFDLFCESAGRSADVTLRFYNEQADRDVSLPPPITESSISLPLFRPGIAPAPNVFGSAGFQTTSAFGEGVSLSSIGPGSSGSVLAVLKLGAADSFGATPSYELLRVTADSSQTMLEAASSDRPVAVESAVATYFAASIDDPVAGVVGLSLRSVVAGSSELFLPASTALEPELRALRAAELVATPAGLELVVQSSFAFDGTSEPILPPEERYYGSFSFVLQESAADPGALTLSSVVAHERDVWRVVPTSDGGRFVVSAELPPRAADATLRVERLDDQGTSVLSYEEPFNASSVELLPTVDGGAWLVLEAAAPTGIVVVTRLDAGGEVVLQQTFSGAEPSAALRPSGELVLSFVGTVAPGGAPDAQIALPGRAVPLLVELSDAGAVTRAAQVACGGQGMIASAGDGAIVLIGTYLERATLGTSSATLSPGSVVAAGVE